VSDEDLRTYRVVRDEEGQYSVWRAEREVPAGWSSEGTTGTRAECLAHIAEIWTDMRPTSLRLQTEGARR
jgi:MbtH protein